MVKTTLWNLFSCFASLCPARRLCPDGLHNMQPSVQLQDSVHSLGSLNLDTLPFGF